MPKHSAGLLCYRQPADGLQVLLVHPGGPFWAGKDHGAWSIPKGEFLTGEDPLDVARREFLEETGFADEALDLLPLGSVRQAGGKVVHAWAFAGNFDLAGFRSNTFLLEWPPRSGQQREFPEVDRMEWFRLAEARERILTGQVPLLDRLEEVLGERN